MELRGKYLPARAPWALALLVVWFFWIALQSGAVIVDGFQSEGAVAGAAGIGRPRWPLVGDYLGYDQAWGFHWFGWSWLKSFLNPVLPWSPWSAMAVLCGWWWIAALSVTRQAGERTGPGIGVLAGLTGLCCPGFVVALQSYRPEIPLAAGLVLLLGCWYGRSRAAMVGRLVLLAVLPILHPLGTIVPVAWCLTSAVLDWRVCGFRSAVRPFLVRMAAVGIGLVGFASWYSLQPQALAQFKMNVLSQRMLVEGLGAGYWTLFRWGLSGRAAVPFLLLLIPALLQAVRLGTRALKDPRGYRQDPLVLAGSGVFAAFAFCWLARNPNPLHFMAVMPLAGWLFADLIHGIFRRFSPAFPYLAGSAAVAVFCAFPIRQTFALIGHGGKSYRAGLAEALASLPQARQVLLPVCFWEAAVARDPAAPPVYRFSTFPNILPNAERAGYERNLMEQVRPGDLLLWDSLQDEGGIFNFVTSTALRHQVIRPFENPDEWERLGDVSAPVSYSRSQPAVFALFRKR